MTKIMDNDYLRDLCISLLKVNTEDEVIKILKSSGYWTDSDSWRYLGDSPANWSTAGNQQSNPVASLVEKIVNSIDAILINECWEAGVDPKSEAAPNSMFDAVEKFFKVSKGLIENLSTAERTKLAERVHLVSTAAKQKDPCYTIVDTGEGQTPSNMPKTLLSLPGTSSPYKSKIEFVQGIFNMGGTGVLRFCGENNLELIISKRNPKLLPEKATEKDTMWGFTIIRRRNPTKRRESSVYEYLAPRDHVLAFKADNIPALPGKYPEAYTGHLSYGTCIKLYEYQIPGKKANILFDLNYELNRHFQRMALPVRLTERRTEGVAGKNSRKDNFWI